MLTLAKLSENDIVPVSQAIYFTDCNLHDNNYKFLELDKHLQETLEVGQILYFAGEDEERAVLCTESRTYNVVHTETSNSLLLTTGMKFFEELKPIKDRTVSKVVVSGIHYDYLEPIHSNPHMKKLTAVLEKTMFKGPEHECTINKDELYSYEELLNIVQASDKELKDALRNMNIAVIEKKVRLIEFEYHFRALSHMLKLIDENSWALDEIRRDDTIETLVDIVHVDIIKSLFDSYCKPSKMFNDEQLYKYDEAKVCKFYAQVLLSTAGRFSFNEFLSTWKESVPDGMIAREEMLYGIALIDLNSNPKSIKAFREDLPDNITERFQVLFEAKEKWSIPEISPYIQ